MENRIIKRRRPMSEATKLKLSIAHKGQCSWKSFSIEKQTEIIKKISTALKNKYIQYRAYGIKYIAHNRGKKMSEEQRCKMRLVQKGIKLNRPQWNTGIDNRITVICSYCKKEVKKNPSEIKNNKQYFCNYQCFYDSLKGRKIPQEILEKIRKNNPCYKKGKDNPFWKNGITYNKELHKKYDKKYRQENKEKISQKHKEYAKTFQGKLCFRIGQHNRRSKVRMIGKLSLETVQSVYEDNIKQYGKLTCILCNNPINFGEDSLEHKMPISRGGTNEYSNLGIAHKLCNISKNYKTIEEYIKWKEIVCQ